MPALNVRQEEIDQMITGMKAAIKASAERQRPRSRNKPAAPAAGFYLPARRRDARHSVRVTNNAGRPGMTIRAMMIKVRLSLIQGMLPNR